MAMMPAGNGLLDGARAAVRSDRVSRAGNRMARIVPVGLSTAGGTLWEIAMPWQLCSRKQEKPGKTLRNHGYLDVGYRRGRDEKR